MGEKLTDGERSGGDLPDSYEMTKAVTINVSKFLGGSTIILMCKLMCDRVKLEESQTEKLTWRKYMCELNLCICVHEITIM